MRFVAVLVAAVVAAAPCAALAQSFPLAQTGVFQGQAWPRGYAPTPDEWKAWQAKADSPRLDAEISHALAAESSTSVAGLPRAVSTLGAVCDGVADAAPALNAAIATVASSGGGTLLVPGRCLIDSADLIVFPTVRLQGTGAAAGELLTDMVVPGHAQVVQSALDFTNLPSTLIINPGHTIRIPGPGALAGITIARKGLTAPKSMRDGINAVAAMSGTAITLSGFDPNLSDLMILGFDRAIDGVGVNRPTITNVRGDNRNGLRFRDAHDIPRVTGVHWWPFLTALQPWTVTHYPVTAAANNGSGAIRVTVASHALQTGDQVFVQAPGVVSTYAGQVTVVDATHLDLPGTTFAGALSGSGIVILDTTRRSGTGFDLGSSESIEITNSFAYGYTKGFYLTTGAGWTHLINCSVDGNYELADPGNIGIAIDSSAYGTSVLGGFISSQAVALYVASLDQEAHSFTGVSINPSAPGVLGRYIQLLGGRALLTGNHSPTANPAILFVGAGVAGVDLVGNTMPNTSVVFGTGAQSKTLLSGNTLAAGQLLMNVPNNARTGVNTLLTDNGTLQVAGMNVAGCPVFSGTGNPQGSIAAPVCSQYLRLDGGLGSTLYIKETGTGNTGWTAK